MPGRNTKKLRKALARALALPGAQGPTEADLEMQRRLDAIIGGLSPEQQEHVLGELEAPGGRRMSNLTREILNLAIGTEKPGVMHPEVARVYREDPRAVPLHDCEDCGLGIPCVAGGKTGGRTIPFRRYFDRCPNCGGHVGYAAYYHKRVEPLDKLRANAEAARSGGHTILADNYERMIADREREAT